MQSILISQKLSIKSIIYASGNIEIRWNIWSNANAVKIRNFISEYNPVTSVVSQGVHLAPLICSVFINDIPQISSEIASYFYLLMI